MTGWCSIFGQMAPQLLSETRTDTLYCSNHGGTLTPSAHMEPRGREDGTPNIYWFIPRVPLGSAPLADSDPLYCNCYCIVKPRCTDWSHSLTPSAQPLALIWNQGTPCQKPNKPPKICSILQIPNATFVILLRHSNSPTSSAQPSWSP